LGEIFQIDCGTGDPKPLIPDRSMGILVEEGFVETRGNRARDATALACDAVDTLLLIAYRHINDTGICKK
jgi:hypothetical protein